MRYLFNSPTVWVMEVSIYVVIVATFISFAYVLLEKGHVKVDFVTTHLSGRTAILLEIATSLFSILYCVVMGWEGFKMAFKSFQFGELSPTILRVPVWIPQFFIPFGSALLTFQFIRYTKDLFRSLTLSEPPKDEKEAARHLNRGISDSSSPGGRSFSSYPSF